MQYEKRRLTLLLITGNKKICSQKFNDTADPADPDAEFNRLRESVTDKKETKTKTKKVSSSCVCFRVKSTAVLSVSEEYASVIFRVEEYAYFFAPSSSHIGSTLLYVH
jgi:hypothetical protein